MRVYLCRHCASFHVGNDDPFVNRKARSAGRRGGGRE